MNFSIAGSTIREQRAVLELALATGKVRHVFWGIDPFAFAAATAAFPITCTASPAGARRSTS